MDDPTPASPLTGYQARPHYWADCPMCGRMVVCGKCGNNCCNAGYGELWPGVPCDACPSAYEMQDRGESDAADAQS
jgi:hypothetical protein